MKVKMTKSDIVRMVNLVLEQDNDSEYVNISPEKYKELMQFAGYNGKGLSNTKMFRGKKIIITGPLNISDTPTASLGNVVSVLGNLDISRTNVSDISGIEVKGRVSDYQTPISRARERKIYLQKLADAQQRREEGDWDLDNEYIDDIGEKANALFEYLVNEGELEGMDDEEKERIRTIKNEIEVLSGRYDEEEDPELADRIYDQISDLETEMEEIEEKGDVYGIIPESYDHYGLTTFEVLELRDQEYAVGTEDEMDRATYEYAVNYIDEVGIEGFNESFIGDYVDGEQVAEYFRDWWRDDIWESPESYFNEDDYSLSLEQEERIDEINTAIAEYEEEQSEYDYSDDEYDEFQELIDELQEELDEIVPDTEPTEEMVDEKLDELLSDVEYYPLQYIKDYDLDIERFIDTEELAQGLVDSDGYGVLSSYDGQYEIVEINGTDYYIIRIN